MQFRSRLSALVAAFAAAAIAMLMVAGGAAATAVDPNAQDPNNVAALNPQTTNVPYVAWAGEQLRFTKCYSAADVTAAGLSADAPLVAHFNVVNPLIDTPSSVIPTWEGGGNTGIGNITTGTEAGGICASGSYYSASPGLADILLNVTDFSGGPTLLPKHDFLGIWLRMNAPTLAELNVGGDFNPAAGATSGTGSFNLGSNGGDLVKKGVVAVTVTGSFQFAGQTWNFPGTDDWSRLARMLATDTNRLSTSPGSAFYRWDIHDNNGLDEGHPAVLGCTTPFSASLPAGVLDAVDNCTGGTNYSRIAGYKYSDLSAIPALGGSDVGPYDPLFPATMLGNGMLDSFDVPMPAAQINLTLSGGTGMFGPTGALEKANKQMLLSRDGTGSDTAHNLYAPYYSQYIPATSRPGDSSGVDGPQNINDVSGFQFFGQYWNWAILNGISGSGNNACLAADGSSIPNAASHEAEFLFGTVYTDEHGIAEALYDPNAGFTLGQDANIRCPSFLTGPSTFTSAIQATAVYPYKKVAGAQVSNVLTKTVTTASLKTVTCVRKGQFEAFCVETVKDPWGNPMSGVDVSFTANSTGNANIQADAAKVGSLDTTDQTFIGSNYAQQIVEVQTGANGMAGVVITDSLLSDCVNVRAENTDTRVNGAGVSVFTDFNPGLGTACAGSGPIVPPVINPPAVTNPTANTVTSNATAPAAPVAPAGATGGAVAMPGGTPSVVSVKAHKATVSISVARFVIVGHTRYLVVRLKSIAATAQTSITLVGKNGKVIGHVVKTVKTNKLVRVMKIGVNVKSVKIASLTG